MGKDEFTSFTSLVQQQQQFLIQMSSQMQLHNQEIVEVKEVVENESKKTETRIESWLSRIEN